MSSEDEQIQQRRANLAKLGELGINAYPHRFDRKDTITDLVQAHSSKTGPELEEPRIQTITSGRILSIRSFGKASFLVLSDGRSRIQVYIRKDSLSDRDFEVFRLLDFGDMVGVEGHLFRTKTNELTIWASRLEFLAKCHLPLPEKWHGLTDVEIRYRQRYLDLIVNPDARAVFQVRSKVLTALREFLDSRGYIEVETPMMQPIAGGAMARPFRTHHNALDVDLYLRIAPELYLKRLVVGGLERVYEINRNFRNEGISTRHNPEFTMLEFYQAYSDYQDLMTMTEEMIAFVAKSAVGKDELTFGEDTISLRAPFARISLRQAAAQAASKKVNETIVESDFRDHAKAANIAGRLGIGVDPKWGPGKITTTIFETLVEDTLVQPTFVYDFPTEVSPLSKQRPDDPETVERFELYIGRIEVANAFSELNDPFEQRRRFEQQLEERAKGDLEAHAMDEDYVRALEYGLPPTAGEGVGVDRLVMLLTDSKSIRDVILFPHMRPRANAEPGTRNASNPEPGTRTPER
jgi:lysyl-tRNA synthetase class 2